MSSRRRGGSSGDGSNIGLHSYLQGLHFMLHLLFQGPAFKSYLFENADKHFNHQSNSRSPGENTLKSLPGFNHACWNREGGEDSCSLRLASGSGDSIQEVPVCSHLHGRVPPCVSRRHRKNSMGRAGMSQELGDMHCGSATDTQVPHSCLFSWK